MCLPFLQFLSYKDHPHTKVKEKAYSFEWYNQMCATVHKSSVNIFFKYELYIYMHISTQHPNEHDDNIKFYAQKDPPRM